MIALHNREPSTSVVLDHQHFDNQVGNRLEREPENLRCFSAYLKSLEPIDYIEKWLCNNHGANIFQIINLIVTNLIRSCK